MSKIDSRNSLIRHYALSYRNQFASEDAAKAHFSGRFEKVPLRFRSLFLKTLGKLWLMACMSLAALVLVEYDIEKIRSNIWSIRSDDHSIAIFLNEKTIPLFKADAIAKYQRCLKGSSRTCFITLQDVRIHPEIMMNPDTHVNDVCGNMYRPAKYFGTQIEYEFAKALDGARREATRCVVKNQEQLKSLEFLEFWRLAAAIALNILGLIGFVLL